MQNYKISLCTQLKDRNIFLDRTLPSWLKYQCDEIVIFDWPEKESAKEIVNKYNDSRIVLVQNLEDEPYSIAMARNTAIRFCKNDLVFYLDSDNILSEKINQINIKKGEFVDGTIDSIKGPTFLWKYMFEELGGFDERMKGWGYEDDDFSHRLVKKGYILKFFEEDMFYHIPHSYELRTRYFFIKNIKESWDNNTVISQWNNWGGNQRKFKVRIYKNDQCHDTII